MECVPAPDVHGCVVGPSCHSCSGTKWDEVRGRLPSAHTQKARNNRNTVRVSLVRETPPLRRRSGTKMLSSPHGPEGSELVRLGLVSFE